MSAKYQRKDGEARLDDEITDEGQVDTKKVPRQRLTVKRLWLFRVVALVVVPVVIVLLLELGLGIAGYGFPPAATIRCRVNGRDAYRNNTKFSWRFFPPNIARELAPFVFFADKPKKTYRIFVLGGSAAMGTPEPAFSFGRILKVMLRREYPGVNFEIITVATVAINSHVVLEIAKDCGRHEPDLFVVYLGNNEVVGPYGAGTVFAPLSANLSVIRLGIAVKAIRLAQLFSNLLGLLAGNENRQVSWRGMQMFLEKQVPIDSPGLQIVYRNFRRNLEDICGVGRKREAGVIVCTVVSNLKDSPPFASLHRADLSEIEKKKWEQIYKDGVAYESAGEYAQAVRCYLAAAEIDDFYADLQYRLGRCYWAMEQYDSAKQRYINAREMDTLRFRADTRINETIRTIASEKTGEGVYLADVVKAFEEHSPDGIVGDNLLYEHVHLNFRGNYLLARTVFEQVRKLLPEWVENRKADKTDFPTEAECARRLVYTDLDRYKITSRILAGYIKKAPFTNQLYHEKKVRQVEENLKGLKARITGQTFEETLIQYKLAIQREPSDWRLRWRYAKLLSSEDLKLYTAALQEYRLVELSLPNYYLIYVKLGEMMLGMGDYEGAAANFLEALRLNPTLGPVYHQLGVAYRRQDRLDKAIECYAKALQLSPEFVPAYDNLGEALFLQGKLKEAERAYRKGLSFAPDNLQLHRSLVIVLSKQGRRKDAIEELRTALKIDPNSVSIRQELERLLRNTPDRIH